MVASADEHVVTGAGDRVYARGIEGKDIGLFDIFEPNGPLIDPDTKEISVMRLSMWERAP